MWRAILHLLLDSQLAGRIVMKKYVHISEIYLPTYKKGFVRLSHYLEWLHTTYMIYEPMEELIVGFHDIDMVVYQIFHRLFCITHAGIHISKNNYLKRSYCARPSLTAKCLTIAPARKQNGNHWCWNKWCLSLHNIPSLQTISVSIIFTVLYIFPNMYLYLFYQNKQKAAINEERARYWALCPVNSLETWIVRIFERHVLQVGRPRSFFSDFINDRGLLFSDVPGATICNDRVSRKGLPSQMDPALLFLTAIFPHRTQKGTSRLEL
jgi:hypothetical protein